jgi:tRNA-dihydrouridine synthase A
VQSEPATRHPIDRRLSVAPMMDWTDRHCRYFLRLIAPRTLLYTEMIPTGAILLGQPERFLRFDPAEHPLALQLGGADPDELARCAAAGAARGYDEINLNVGCPSDRVQSARFGACLMAEPELVAACVRAMRAAAAVPVTVKTRVGIDREDSYAFLRRFVEAVAGAGCRTVILHARNAWLSGLSPKENREIPPLRYELVAQLKREFPHLTIAVNGGLKTPDEIAAQLEVLDGVMVGREAYHEPWSMAQWDSRFFGQPDPATSREQVEAAWLDYLERVHASGRSWAHAMRHALGLWNGTPGARRWRQVWSDHRLKTLAPHEVAKQATAARLSGLASAA